MIGHCGMNATKSTIRNGNGEMAERFKAAVLKTVERKLRGFESLSLRQFSQLIIETWKLKILYFHFTIFKFQCRRDFHGEVAERLKAAAC